MSVRKADNWWSVILMTRVYIYFFCLFDIFSQEIFRVDICCLWPQSKITMVLRHAFGCRNRRLPCCRRYRFAARCVLIILCYVHLPCPHSFHLACPDIPRPLGLKAGCLVGSQPRLYFLTWIPALIFESILCFLMLYKAWKMYNDQYKLPLLRLIIRDRCVI